MKTGRPRALRSDALLAEVELDERCDHCLQAYRREEVYLCAWCDHPACAVCIRLERSEPVCPGCREEDS